MIKKLINKLKNTWVSDEIDPGSLLWESGSKTRLISDEQRAFWEENGYLILETFFKESEVDLANDLIDKIWKERKNSMLTIDIFIGTEDEKRIKFSEADENTRNEPYKLNDLFLEYDEIRDMVINEKLNLMLADLLDGDPLVCNGLSFERGSQQKMHFDTFYMPPPVENKMLATWISLEDTTENSGPLVYYPKSHKIAPYYFSDGRLNLIESEINEFNTHIEKELADKKLVAETFLPKKGDVLIWHAQLFHGGSKIVDKKLTRKSLVSHYFRASDFPSKRVHTYEPGKHSMIRDHQYVEVRKN